MGNQTFKNKIELFIALFLFCLTLPIQIFIFIILVVEIKGFPIFIQKRGLTLTKRRFNIYKFRTIRNNKYKGNQFTSDVFNKNYLTEYIPPFCRLLRKTGLDELPQLLNVIRGEMSLIGPRPLSIDDLLMICVYDNEAYQIRDKIKSKPGITGLWQIYGDRNKGIDELISLESYYENNKSFSLDLKIFKATIPVIFMGMHSDAILDGKVIKGQIGFIHNTIY